jgi:Zn-dependent protease with chaperone function
MTSQPSMTGRALMAVGLMIGFYVLAIGIAFGLLWIPYAEFVYAERLHLKLAAGCVLGALAILWSVIPRRDKFVTPGPRLDPAKHPRLFAQLNSVAGATGQAMPRDVYVVSDVNAWVSERGGVMGLGSERIMGLGLPLMRVLKISELRAVLAHEFGHFHGGDTKLGPWIYKTRSAIGRTLANLGDDSWIQKPFLWYGNLFLRVTHAISRQQEYAADALAARVAGSRSLMTGLRTIHGAALAHGAFWSGEVVPLLEAGYRPPMADGFAKFLSARDVAVSVEKSIDQELKEGQGDPYDTHPPLRQRLAALKKFRDTSRPEEEPAAITLLEDLNTIERDLLVTLAGPDLANKLESLEWKDAGPKVYLPLWARQVQTYAPVLGGVTPDRLPGLAKDPSPFRGHAQKLAERHLSDEELVNVTAGVVGCALAVALAERGCVMSCDVGMPVFFQAGETRIQPFSVIPDLREGTLTAEAWQSQYAAFGILRQDLGALSSKRDA